MDDERLRAALARLRHADERDAPSFDEVLQGRSRPLVASRRSRLGAVLGLAAGLLIAALAYRMLRPDRLSVPSAVVALSRWRAASDVLLDTPGRGLLTHAPQLGASLIDIKGGIPR